MKVTLGGDRLGSGQKMKVDLKTYNRSTHNMSQRWKSSMQCGTLYPFLCIPTMRGDAFDIDLEAAAKTIPTKGPLFGSFKMQLDVFFCATRLYQALLHNNPQGRGLDMSQVKLPKLEIGTSVDRTDTKNYIHSGEFNNSCLLKYLGMSGLGRPMPLPAGQSTDIYRRINAVPALAYFDIFKNYYSNKQEENAYIISGEAYEEEGELEITNLQTDTEISLNETFGLSYTENNFLVTGSITLDKVLVNLKFKVTGDTPYDNVVRDFYLEELIEGKDIPNVKLISYDPNNLSLEFQVNVNGDASGINAIQFIDYRSREVRLTNEIVAFPLSNIDDMRYDILSHHTLGQSFVIDEDNAYLPYNILVTRDEYNSQTLNKFPLNGLLLKTYQSDIYNNWINSAWIDGENGISAITKINTANGLTIDALNLAEKLYNMLNRVAVAGATYEDWQDVVYQESPKRHIESPVYLGGMSSEVVFEEIVQTAPASVGEDSQLGTLGGRGTLIKRKGGKVHAKCDEAGFIIGIVSLTPRIVYTSGNEWYMTEMDSIDDLHKSALDGIGYQNLLVERMDYHGTLITDDGSLLRSACGKLPAWIDYMTAVDKAYGDFAEKDGKGFMVLSRNYETDGNGQVSDITTYIDPRKFNYAFAYNEIDSQNFWVEIYSDIKARRLMSAHQIPNV